MCDCIALSHDRGIQAKMTQVCHEDERFGNSLSVVGSTIIWLFNSFLNHGCWKPFAHFPLFLCGTKTLVEPMAIFCWLEIEYNDCRSQNTYGMMPEKWQPFCFDLNALIKRAKEWMFKEGTFMRSHQTYLLEYCNALAEAQYSVVNPIASTICSTCS